jgi:hypothetical protein
MSPLNYRENLEENLEFPYVIFDRGEKTKNASSTKIVLKAFEIILSLY